MKDRVAVGSLFKDSNWPVHGSFFVAFLAGFLSLAAASTAQAQLVPQISNPGGQCGGDVLGQAFGSGYGAQEQGCNAGEISISDVVDVEFDDGLITECVIGDVLSISSMTVNYSINTQARRDLILWIGDQEGTDPRQEYAGSESCSSYSLPGPFNPTPDNTNPFGNIPSDDDSCGDLAAPFTGQASRTFTGITFSCQDFDNDGFADSQILLTWIQNDQTSCGLETGESFPVTGAKSKCDFEFTNYTLPIVYRPRLTLIKQVTNDDGGTALETDWTLSATGPTSISGVTGTAAVTDVEVDEGTYTLGETGPGGYVGTWQCVGATVSNNQITLTNANPAQEVTCTLTNDDQPAVLTLQKTVINDNGGTAVDTDWTLTATGPDTISGVEGDAAITNAPVATGTYTLTESGGPAGYVPGDWQCTGGGSLTGNQLTLGLGDSAVCTITNDDDAPSLTLVKQVTNDNGGTAVPGDWTLTAAGYDPQLPQIGTYDLSESGPAGYTLTSLTCDNAQGQVSQVTLGLGEDVTCTFVNDDDAPSLTLVKEVNNDFGGNAVPGDWTLTAAGYDAQNPQAGTYDLSEQGPDGYTQTSLTCDNAQGEVTSVTLGLGENVTCTFVNNDVAPTLTLVKEVDNTGGGTLGPGDFTLLVSGCAGTAVEKVDDPYVDQGGGVAVSNVWSNCSYAISENPVADYTLTGIACVDGAQNPVSYPPLTMGEGQDVTCTVTNTFQASGTIQVLKEVTNDNGGQLTAADFALQITATEGCNAPAGDVSSGYVLANPVNQCEYTVSETAENGYTQTGILCAEESGVLDTDGTFTFNSGDTWVCTVSNDDDAPSLTLVKQVTNDNGGTAVPGDWTLIAAGYDPQLPQIGTYDLSESGPAGYTLTSLTCDNAEGQVTSVTLGLGENVTCTFVNDDDAPSLTLVKEVNNNSGGTAVPGDWTLTAEGYDPQNPQAGTYVLSEQGPDGYTLSSLTCDNAQGQVTSVTLGLGENVTCTFVNDDSVTTLTLVKAVINDDGGTAIPVSFTLTLQGADGVHDTAQNYSSGDMPAVQANVTYTMDELDDVAGYENIGVACVDNGDGTDPVVTNGQFTLELGQNATCTLTNDDIAPTLTLEKVVINDDGGELTPADFDLTLTGDDGTHASGVDYKDGDMPVIEAGTSYKVSEEPPQGYEVTGIGCELVVDDGANTTLPNPFTPLLGQDVICTVTNDDLPPQAGFTVTKVFDDENTSAVQMKFQCDDGFTSDDAYMITKDEYKRFVLTDYQQGSADCRIWEDPAPDGYKATYTATTIDGEAGSVYADADGCHFEDVVSGEFACEVLNEVLPVDVTVYKVWDVMGEGGLVPLEVDVRLYCNAEIVGSDGDDGQVYYKDFGTFLGNDNDTAQVYPEFPSSDCWATESGQEMYIEVDNGCGIDESSAGMTVSAGNGDDCTITNTVFFEGIPTLNQYGMMLLALLMLGAGFVGYRRFA